MFFLLYERKRALKLKEIDFRSFLLFTGPFPRRVVAEAFRRGKITCKAELGASEGREFCRAERHPPAAGVAWGVSTFGCVFQPNSRPQVEGLGRFLLG